MARTTIPTDRVTLDQCINDIIFRNSDGQITPENHARLLGFILDLLPTLLNNLPAGTRLQASALDGLTLTPGPEGRFDVPVYRVVAQGTDITTITVPSVTGFTYNDNTHQLSLSGLTTGWVQTFPTYDPTTQDILKSFAEFIPAADELGDFSPVFEIGAEGAAGRDGRSFNYRDRWQSSANYVFMDVVYDRGSAWLCLIPHSSNNQNRPPEDENDTSTFWGLLLPRAERGADGIGFEYQGLWTFGTTYTKNQWVTNPVDNLNYVARPDTHTANLTNNPPNPLFWVLMAPAGRDGRDGVDGIDGVDGDAGEPGEPGTPAPIPVELFRKRLSTEAIPTVIPTADFDPTPGIERLTNITPNDWSETYPTINPLTEQVDRSFSKYFFTGGGRLLPFSVPALAGQVGPPGAAGQDGSKTLFGDGVPANTLGNNGDQYFDRLTGTLYGKTAGAWDAGTSLRGPMGSTVFASGILSTIRRKLVHSNNIDVVQERTAYNIGYRLPVDTSRDDVKVVFELDFASNPSVLYKYELATTWGDLRRAGGITHSISTSPRALFGGTTTTIFINIRATPIGGELLYQSSVAGLNLRPLSIFEEEVETTTLGSRWTLESTYGVGQWVVYNGVLYECLVANTATDVNRPDVDTNTWAVLLGGTTSGGGGGGGGTGNYVFENVTLGTAVPNFEWKEGGSQANSDTTRFPLFEVSSFDYLRLTVAETSGQPPVDTTPTQITLSSANTVVRDISLTSSNIYVLNPIFGNPNVSDRIYVYNLDGTFDRTINTSIVSGNNAANGITVTGSFIYVVDSTDRGIYRYSSAGITFGNIINLHTNNTQPSSMASTPSLIYVIDSGRDSIFVYNDIITYQRELDLHENNTSPQGIEVTSTNIYVTDFGRRSIFVYDLNGVYQEEVTLNSANTQPRGIGINSTHIYIGDSSTNTLFRYPIALLTRALAPTLYLYNSSTPQTDGSNHILDIAQTDARWNNFIYQIPANMGISHAGLSVDSTQTNVTVRKLTFPT